MKIAAALKRLFGRSRAAPPAPAGPELPKNFVHLEDAPYNPGTTPTRPREDGADGPSDVDRGWDGTTPV